MLGWQKQCLSQDAKVQTLTSLSDLDRRYLCSSEKVLSLKKEKNEGMKSGTIKRREHVSDNEKENVKD